MEGSKAKSTPMESNLKLAKNEGKPLEDAMLFRQLVGSLFYLTITRPDIAFSVGVIYQFMGQPCEGHLIVAKRILRYIKGTLSYGLMYEQSKIFSLSGFVDADWAGDVNDRCSTTGFCFTTGSAAISWCSKKQTTMALSSCEAEYVAATMATQESCWKLVFHARSKHIETHYHFVREKVLSQDIELLKIQTDEQVADIFTKALAKTKFEVFRGDLGIIDKKLALREAVTS
ncbi:secreted RxLR effector protein 161-like [Gossypium arboreum]|uniref:secreted RxLR effector protein 161-like n=1 Tax=Gossypium arboreum TaxID=29729 RepID=UPI0022F1D52E|nr:secreted RxLR effector protein 161-like [Gossypium arboreum]